MESWVSKLGAAIGQQEMTSASDLLKLEEALCNWHSLAEKAIQNIFSVQTENENKSKPCVFHLVESHICFFPEREFIHKSVWIIG